MIRSVSIGVQVQMHVGAKGGIGAIFNRKWAHSFSVENCEVKKMKSREE